MLFYKEVTKLTKEPKTADGKSLGILEQWNDGIMHAGQSDRLRGPTGEWRVVNGE
jgi:hypothetical protein